MSAPDANGWFGIETAPKGLKLLISYRNRIGNWRIITARYYLPGTLDAADDAIDTDEDGFAPEGWYEESETHDDILMCSPPSHWQPLPSPPITNSLSSTHPAMTKPAGSQPSQPAGTPSKGAA